MSKIKIENAEIIFASLVDSGFGTSLTIKVTPEIEKQVTEFWKTNNIGNEKTVIGVPNFKEYEGTKQLNLKINDKTAFAGINGLSKDNLGFGCKVNMIVNAFEYSNKFTRGKAYMGASVSAVVILSGRKTGADADLAELLGEVAIQDITSDAVDTTPKEKTDLPF